MYILYFVDRKDDCITLLQFHGISTNHQKYCNSYRSKIEEKYIIHTKQQKYKITTKDVYRVSPYYLLSQTLTYICFDVDIYLQIQTSDLISPHYPYYQ